MGVKALVYLLKAYTAIHQGVGQVPAPVDLPIARERHTGYPILRHLKGPIRAWYRRRQSPGAQGQTEEEKEIFGPEAIQSQEDASAGALIFSDGYLLLFPVRAAFKPFYLVTCPYIIKRFNAHMEMLGCGCKLPEISVAPDVAKVPHVDDESFDVLEGFSIKLVEDCKVKALESALSEVTNGAPIMVVPDHIFAYFVRQFTEVVPRVKLDPEKGTVDQGPWWEEYVPAEAVFYMWIQERKGGSLCKMNALNGAFLNVGGDTTVGRGKVKFIQFEAQCEIKNLHTVSGSESSRSVSCGDKGNLSSKSGGC